MYPSSSTWDSKSLALRLFIRTRELSRSEAFSVLPVGLLTVSALDDGGSNGGSSPAVARKVPAGRRGRIAAGVSGPIGGDGRSGDGVIGTKARAGRI